MHQAAIRSLGLVEDRLRKHSPEKNATHYKDKGKENFKYQSSQSQTSDSSGDKKHRTQKEDARNIIAQARVNNARYTWKEENYEDDEKEMGALCFTRRVCRTRVPKGFKLPHDQQKYDGSQDPKLWLSDYLQAVQILRGTRAKAMQSLQLHLTGVTRSWLSTLATQRFHRKLGRIRESIRKKISFDIQTSNITRRSQVLHTEKG
jgi:hypothetical protein